MPLYDVPVQLPSKLGDYPANRHLIDFRERRISRAEAPIDISTFAAAQRIWFRF